MNAVASLGAYVEAFEEAHAHGRAGAIEDYLPARGHPLRREVLLELVRIDLEHGWLAGRPLPVECYRQRFPELFADANAVREVLFEDYRLRQELGVLAGSTAQESDTAPLGDLPEVGGWFAGFRVLAQLGKGSFGRVFLVEQAGLAGRPVVLKIGGDLFRESQALAQLQHTHIVPIYSAHTERGWQALCMPFLGTLTLADLLAGFARLGRPRSGRDWLAVAAELQRDQRELNLVELPQSGCPHAHPLRHTDHVGAALWVGECLADGLAHAHQRGLLHRDIKPANVLLTDDGTPMLLDFNLVQDAGEQRPALGGTLMYMAPEELDGFLNKPRLYDARSDVYSLGLVLYELLAGAPPWRASTGPAVEVARQLHQARSQEPPCVGERCPAAPPGVRAILRRCLHPDPQQRYPSAAALHDDLARQRQHLPLLHVRESATARVRKFVRRHPRLLPLACVSTLTLLTLLLVALVTVRSRQLSQHAARAALARLVEEIPQAELEARLASPADPVALAEAERRCQAAGVLAADGMSRHLPHLNAEERATHGRLLGGLLLSRVQLRRLKGENDQALALNAEAEGYLGTARAVLAQRVELLRALGQAEAASQAEQAAALLPAPTAEERALTAARLRGQGQLRPALDEAEAALGQDPTDFRLWFELGLCRLQVDDQTGALTAFDGCLGLAPRATLARFLRGCCHLRRAAHALALADFDRVLLERPDLVEARLNRALALAGLNRLRAAADDLTAVIEQRPGCTRALFLRADLWQRLGDQTAAAQDRREGLRREPTDVLSWLTRALARQESEPRHALADIDRALTLDPHSTLALQNRAHVLAERLNRSDEAAAALARLLALRPTDTEARAARAVCLARVGRRSEALAEVQRCLAGPAGATVLHRVACVFALTMRDVPRHRAEALFYLFRAVQMGAARDTLAADNDLAALRGDADFQALVTPHRGGHTQ